MKVERLPAGVDEMDVTAEEALSAEMAEPDRKRRKMLKENESD